MVRDHSTTLYAHLSPFPGQMTGSAMCTMGLKIAQVQFRKGDTVSAKEARMDVGIPDFVHNGSMCVMGLITRRARGSVWQPRGFVGRTILNVA